MPGFSEQSGEHMPSQRVYEVAKELGLDRQVLVTKINELSLGFTANNYMTKLSPEEISELKAALGNSDKGEAKVAKKPKKAAESKPAASEESEQPGIVTRTRVRRKSDEAEGDADTKADEASGDVIAPTVRRRRKKVVVGEVAEGEASAEISTKPVARDAEAQEEVVEAEVEEAPVADEVESTPVVEETVEAAAEPAEEEAAPVEAKDATETKDVAEAPAEVEA